MIEMTLEPETLGYRITDLINPVYVLGRFSVIRKYKNKCHVKPSD